MTIRKADEGQTIIIIILIGIMMFSVGYFGQMMRDNIFNPDSLTFKCEKLTGRSELGEQFHAIFQFQNTGDKDISLSHIHINISLIRSYDPYRILLSSKECGTLFLPKSNEVYRVESFLNIDDTEFEEYLKTHSLKFEDLYYQAIIQTSDILIEISAEVKNGFLSRQVIYSDSFPYSNIEWT